MQAMEGLRPGARVAVGLSGGVDSSVTAILLKHAGFEVLGLTMRVWDGRTPSITGGRPACFGPGELEDVARLRAFTDRLGIEFLEVPLADDYAREVLEYARQEYLAGRTPNPCVRCNRRIKLDRLLERARSQGLRFEAFATGHYARRIRDTVTGRIRLFRAADISKDQSYFLAGLTPAQLDVLRLPLGGLEKREVRRLACDAGFEDFAKLTESQDFLEGGYDVLFQAGEATPGDITDREGRVLGRHRGLPFYTVGQRKGLGIGGAGEPWYVIGLDAEKNRVVVGRRDEAGGRRLRAVNPNWIAWERPPAPEFRASCRVRVRHEPAPAIARAVGDDALEITFDEPQFAIAPGQFAVLYRGNEVLGAAVIDTAW